MWSNESSPHFHHCPLLPELDAGTLRNYCRPSFPKSGGKVTFLKLSLSLGLSSGGAQDMLVRERKTEANLGLALVILSEKNFSLATKKVTSPRPGDLLGPMSEEQWSGHAGGGCFSGTTQLTAPNEPRRASKHGEAASVSIWIVRRMAKKCPCPPEC